MEPRNPDPIWNISMNELRTYRGSSFFYVGWMRGIFVSDNHFALGSLIIDGT